MVSRTRATTHSCQARRRDHEAESVECEGATRSRDRHESAADSGSYESKHGRPEELVECVGVLQVSGWHEIRNDGIEGRGGDAGAKSVYDTQGAEVPQPCLTGDDQEGNEADYHRSRNVRPQQQEPAIHAVAHHASGQKSEKLRDGRADTEDREPCR